MKFLPASPFASPLASPLASLLVCSSVLAASPTSAQLGLPYCAGALNSTGGEARVALGGVGDANLNGLTLECRGLPQQSFGCFLVSSSRASAAPFPGSSGTLCLGPPVWIDSANVAQADASGRVSVPLDLAALPSTQWPAGIRNGDTLRFQYWYRDAAVGGARTSRLSNAVAHTFSPGLYFASPSRRAAYHAYRLEATDLDQDGRYDFVALHREAARLSVFLARNDGSFAPAYEWPTVGGGEDLAVGDFDGDGHSDVAVAGFSTNSLVLHWGMGDGRLSHADSFAGVDRPGVLVAGDFDGDGVDDIIVSQLNQPLVFFSIDAAGVFGRRHNVISGQPLSDLAAADMDGDGRLDLIGANHAQGRLAVWRGLGAGQFVFQHSVFVGASARKVAVGDVDGDGNPDVVVAHSGQGGNTHALVRGLPAGGLAAPSQYGLIGEREATALLDLDGDGRSELLVPDSNALKIYRYMVNGFSLAPEVQPFPSAPRITLGIDLDRDGNLDVVSAGSSDQLICALLGRGDRTFDTVDPIPGVGGQTSAVVGDIDGDGHRDVVMIRNTSAPSATITALLCRAAPLPEVTQSSLNLSFAAAEELADFDGDGALDLVVSSSYPASLNILTNVGQGRFSLTQQLLMAAPASRFRALDFDNDGDVDLVNSSLTSAELTSWVNQGNGVFAPSSRIDRGNYTLDFAALDVDGDGASDLVVAGWSGVAWLRSTGAGQFAAPVPLYFDAAIRLGVCDVDGDAREDLVVAGRAVTVLHHDGPGVLRPGSRWKAEGYPRAIRFGDFNGDRELDIALHYQYGSFVHLRLGSGDGQFPGEQTHFLGSYVGVICPTDIDLDGDLDIVCTNGPNQSSPTILRNRIR